MDIIAVASQKGGVGKTPTSVNLAFAFGRAGYKVLLVDTDPQASLTEYLIASATYEQDITLYNALLDIEAIEPIGITDNIHLLNSSDDLFAAEYKLLTGGNPDGRLKVILEHYKGEYDFCVIDTPPNLGLLTRNALGAANQVFIPIKTEITAQRTLKRFFDTLNDVYKSGLNRGFKVWYILPTMYDSRLNHHNDILKAIQIQYKEQVYPEPSKLSTKYNDATTSKQDVGALDATLGKYWDRIVATHPSIRKADSNG